MIVSTTLTASNADIIGDGLDSVVQQVDRCVVIDTGARDDTLEVARRVAGEKLLVREFPWKDDFAAARNFALEAAQAAGAEWAITVDTDERLLFEPGFDLAQRLPEARRGDPKARAAYDAAFEQFADLRQEALLANPLLAFDKLLLVKRFTGYALADFHNCNEPGQPVNWQANSSLPSHGYDNEIAVLSPVRPDGRMSTLHRPADMAYVGDVDLDWDADRLLFSSVNSRNRWQVFEIGADGKVLRQVTRDDPPDVDNFDACYLPDRRNVFASTLAFQGVIC